VRSRDEREKSNETVSPVALLFVAVTVTEFSFDKSLRLQKSGYTAWKNCLTLTESTYNSPESFGGQYSSMTIVVVDP
jgi:hypothetical protein